MKSRGFTLLELLVAVAVLAAIMVLMLQVVAGILQSTKTQARQMDAVASVRRALETLAIDLSRALPPDTAPLLLQTTGNGFAMLVQRRGPEGAPDHRFLGVRYQSGTSGEILRAYASVPTSQTDWIALMTGSMHETILGDGVVAWRVMVVNAGGTHSSQSPDPGWSDVQWKGTAIPAGWAALRTRSAGAGRTEEKGAATLEIWAAATDSQTFDLIGKTGALDPLRKLLGEEADPSKWRSAIDNHPSFPPPAKSGVRILTKTLPLP